MNAQDEFSLAEQPLSPVAVSRVRRAEEQLTPSTSPKRAAISPASPAQHLFVIQERPAQEVNNLPSSRSPFIVNSIAVQSQQTHNMHIRTNHEQRKKIKKFINDCTSLIQRWSTWKLCYFQEQYYHFTEQNKENHQELEDLAGLVNSASHRQLIQIESIKEFIEDFMKNDLKNIDGTYHALKQQLSPTLNQLFGKSKALLINANNQIQLFSLWANQLTEPNHCLRAEHGYKFTMLLQNIPANLISIKIKLEALSTDYVDALETHLRELNSLDENIFKGSVVKYQESTRQIRERLSKITAGSAFIHNLKTLELELKNARRENIYQPDNVDLLIAQKDITQLSLLHQRMTDLKAKLNEALGETETAISERSQARINFNGIR